MPISESRRCSGRARLRRRGRRTAPSSTPFSWSVRRRRRGAAPVHHGHVDHQGLALIRRCLPTLRYSWSPAASRPMRQGRLTLRSSAACWVASSTAPAQQASPWGRGREESDDAVGVGGEVVLDVRRGATAALPGLDGTSGQCGHGASFLEAGTNSQYSKQTERFNLRVGLLPLSRGSNAFTGSRGRDAGLRRRRVRWRWRGCSG